MATVYPDYQQFFDLPDGQTLIVTKAIMAFSNNQIPIAPPVQTNEGSAGQQLFDVNDVALTSYFYVNSSGNLNINNVGTDKIGKSATLVTIHPIGNA